jgi:membrane dipeptidase
MRIPALFTLAAAGLSIAVLDAQVPSSSEADLVRRARAIHDRVITLDTHNDIEPGNFTAARNYTQRLDTQVNLPKMTEGGLDASFFIVYVGQPNLREQPDALSPAGYDRAYRSDIAKFDAVHRLAEQIAPDKIGLALTADDVRRIAASGRKVVLIGVENAYPIGEDLTRVKEFYDRGGRYMSLAHNGNNQLSDSNTGERDGYTWKNGISPMGERVIAEMNRLGMMVDVSHPSKGSMMRAAELSKAPIIASHSAVRALCDVSRNMDDEMMKALAKTDGVMQIVAFSTYIKTTRPDSPERAAALTALRREFGLPEPPAPAARGAGTASAGTTATAAGRAGASPGGRGATTGTGTGRGTTLQAAVDALPPARRAEYGRALAEIDTRLPGDPPATVKDFVNHIDYAVKMIGVDHVGISSDFDGGGGIVGWKDASETFNVTLELVRRGYTEDQIAKIWSGNLLRVMDRTQAIAKQLQGK